MHDDRYDHHATETGNPAAAPEQVRRLSRTDRNLWSAVIGEAQAHLLYTAYAMKAMEEGHPEVAQVFLEAAGAETIHGVNHLRTLGRVGDTAQNLRAVIEGEAEEVSTLYPRMIREAEAEGRADAAASFRLAWEREQRHLRRFQEALRQMGVPATAPSPPPPPQPARRGPPPEAFESEAVREVLREKERIAGLARIREVVFGMQDGLISTVALVSTVYGAVIGTVAGGLASLGQAVDTNFVVIVAGLASVLAGVLSMATGTFLGSRAEREMYEAEIQREARELELHPEEELAELVELYRQEGLTTEQAEQIAEHIAADRSLMLNTMIEKELGLSPDLPGSPLKDALAMGVAFLVGGVFPLAPYFFMLGVPALAASIGATGGMLFLMGAAKTRVTHRHPLRSGLEVLAIGAASGVGGYLLGTVLPTILGVPAVNG